MPQDFTQHFTVPTNGGGGSVRSVTTFSVVGAGTAGATSTSGTAASPAAAAVGATSATGGAGASVASDGASPTTSMMSSSRSATVAAPAAPCACLPRFLLRAVFDLAFNEARALAAAADSSNADFGGASPQVLHRKQLWLPDVHSCRRNHGTKRTTDTFQCTAVRQSFPRTQCAAREVQEHAVRETAHV